MHCRGCGECECVQAYSELYLPVCVLYVSLFVCVCVFYNTIYASVTSVWYIKFQGLSGFMLIQVLQIIE